MLPDLIVNATLIEESSFLHIIPLMYLECAMEENCAASSAYKIREQNKGTGALCLSTGALCFSMVLFLSMGTLCFSMVTLWLSTGVLS